jgi:CheY-like chemotaxis protein
MALNVIICDDSKFARNQLMRVIPKSVVGTLYQAENGLEAMKLLHEGCGELLFLDLTMPVMDGYQVLEAIKKENIDILTIVVSGDIQPQAQKIIAQYNVLSFLKKPLDANQLLELLCNFGLCSLNENSNNDNTVLKNENNIGTIFDELKEKLNIATGIAASKMGDFLNLFITMPVPNIKIEKGISLFNTIQEWLNIDENIIVSQGFIGNGIIGESLIFFSQEDINNYSHLVGEQTSDKKNKTSQIIELSGLISGSLMRGFAAQFNCSINLNHPDLVPNMKNNLTSENMADQDILCAELTYEIKDLAMNIKYYILFTSSTTQRLKEIMAFV